VLLTHTALPFLLGNFRQWRLKTGQVVDGRTGITAQQITEPVANMSNLIYGVNIPLIYYKNAWQCQCDGCITTPVLFVAMCKPKFTNKLYMCAIVWASSQFAVPFSV